MSQTDSIYEKLLQLPLFQGHSRDDLIAITTKIRIDFRTFRTHQVITTQDDPCKNIIFLMDGEVSVAHSSIHKDLLFVEHFTAPRSFGSETLFGLRQNHSHTITALGDVKTLMVDKYSVINYLFGYEVFRFNMLNKLTAQIQRNTQLLWTQGDNSLEQNFILLCKRNFTHPAGYKQIEGGMVSLAHAMNTPRIHISNMLNRLEEKQLVTLSRKKIIIPQLERLIREV